MESSKSEYERYEKGRTSMMRVYNSTRLIVKALAESEGVPMASYMDGLVRREAAEKGFSIKEEKVSPKKDVVPSKEIVVPVL